MKSSEWSGSYFPNLAMEGIQSLYFTSNRPLHTIHEHVPVLLAVSSGAGSLQREQETYELSQGTSILLPPGAKTVVITGPGQPLHIYMLTISTQAQTRTTHEGSMSRVSMIGSAKNVEYFMDEPAIATWLEELFMHRLPESETRHMRNQIVFHQVLLALLERMETGHSFSDQPSMERSLAYMENHFNEKITTELLAEMAGVSRSHYSILFKQMTGFSPNEYLSKLRVHRAKELIIGSTLSLRDIALKVGYKDEFYLSRRFKHQTGESPSSYSRSRNVQRAGVWFAPYASHLFLLGIEPAIIISESSEYVRADGLLTPQTVRFIHMDTPAEQIKAALQEENVDLIIAAKQHLRENGLTAEQLRSVAPIIEVPWMELGWKEHLRTIAHAIQKSEIAERWLADFEQQERRARETVQEWKVVDETVTIVVIRPERLQIYGARNAGYVLYHSLGLKPSAKIAQEIEHFGDEFHSVSIERSELKEYEGDWFLVMVFPDEKGSTAHAERIFVSEEWQGLSAVKYNRVHVLNQEEWIPYNPVSIRLQLERALKLWAGNQ